MSNNEPQTHREVLAIVLEAWERCINNAQMDRQTTRALRKVWRCGPPEWKPALERIAQLHDVDLSKNDVAEMRDRLMDGLRDTLAGSTMREPFGVMCKDLDSLVESGMCSAADAMRLGIMMGKLEDRLALGVNGKPVTERARRKESHE